MSLVVKISGKNFAPGAKADFFLSGTTNPAGVTVHGTQWMSATEVDATIDIADTASLALFDIKVSNTNGRSGKGSDLFQVIQKTAKISCSPVAAPELTLVGRLNGAAAGGGAIYTNGFGQRAAVGMVTRPDNTRALVILAPTRNNRAYVFVADPLSLQSLQPVQVLDLPPIDPSRPFYPQYGTVTGDLDGNGVPDFAMANTNPGTVYVLFGVMDSTGHIDYSAVRMATPAGADSVTFGAGLGAGNLNDQGGDELVVVGGMSSKGKGAGTGTRIFVYKFTGSTPVLDRTIDPTLSPSWESGESLGTFGIGVGDVTGDGHADLVLGSATRDVNGITNAGTVFVFNGPTFAATPSTALVSSAPSINANFGVRVAVVPRFDAIASSARDVLVSSEARADLTAGATMNPLAQFMPVSGFDNGWAYYGMTSGDANGDGLLDFAIPAHWAQVSSTCGTMGAVYVYLSRPGGWQRVTLEPPDLSGSIFGTGVAITPDGFLLVGDTSTTVNGTAGAGQIYVYRVSPPAP